MDQAENLELGDFTCCFLVVVPVRITLAERDRRLAQEEERRQTKSTRHREHVEEVAEELRFDE